MSIDWQWRSNQATMESSIGPLRLTRLRKSTGSPCTIVLQDSAVPDGLIWQVFTDGSYDPLTGRMGWAFVLMYHSTARWWGWGSVQLHHMGDHWLGLVGRSSSGAEAVALYEMASRWPAYPPPLWPRATDSVWICTDSQVALAWASGSSLGTAEPYLSHRLWLELRHLQLLHPHIWFIQHVAAHKGIRGNELADSYADKGRKMNNGEGFTFYMDDQLSH